MKITDRIQLQSALGIGSLLLALAGCAGPGSVRPEAVAMTQPASDTAQNDRQQNSRGIQPGDSAEVHYLCRLSTGEIVASTDRVSEDQPKSNIFLARDEAGPLVMVAANPEVPAAEERELSFEEEIEVKLARAMVGLKEGERRQVGLMAGNIPARDGREYISRLSRVRRRPKELKMPATEYRHRTQQDPEVGQTLAIDPAFPGRVEAVTDEYVLLRFSGKPGEVIETPFGPGLVREDENDYFVDIDARKDTLIRAGNLVGRITEVDDRAITVDFRDPLGGETLSCNVTVGKIADAKPIKETQEKSDR